MKYEQMSDEEFHKQDKVVMARLKKLYNERAMRRLLLRTQKVVPLTNEELEEVYRI